MLVFSLCTVLELSKYWKITVYKVCSLTYLFGLPKPASLVTLITSTPFLLDRRLNSLPFVSVISQNVLFSVMSLIDVHVVGSLLKHVIIIKTSQFFLFRSFDRNLSCVFFRCESF